MKRWGWRYWAVLIGYSTAVFISTHWFVYLKLLSFLSLFLTFDGARIIRMEMVDYLHDNYPEEWGDIARDMSNYDWHNHWYRHGILSFDWRIEDPDYMELRNQYKSARGAYWFSCFASIATFIYAAVNSTHH